ncbi:MAG TPA: phage tail protein [Cyanothece sp. UBA12306]|nr:phage tail protein [Cyanothece sp. UBA12306]
MGEFPEKWYQIIKTDNKLLSFIILVLMLSKSYNFLFLFLPVDNQTTIVYPHEEINIIIQWKIPIDFFEFRENPKNCSNGNGLKLDYKGYFLNFYQLSLSHYPLLFFLLLFLIQNQINSLALLFIKKFIKYNNSQIEFNLYVRPDSLYLSFLPDIYKQIDFIGRFLNIFEQTFEPDVNTLDNLWGYFNPMLTSETFLPFLSHWVGWKLTPLLSLSQQRYLVSQAIELYKWKGTRYGLRLYLHLCTNLPLDENLPEAEKHISIEETFGKRLTLGSSQLGLQTRIGGGKIHHFKVTLKTLKYLVINESLIHQIIEQQKPAFSTYELIIK